MKKQGRKVPQTNQDITITEPRDSAGDEMSEKEFRMYIIKMTCELKNDLNEKIQAKIYHTNKEIREQIQDANPACLWGPCEWYVFSHPFTFSLWMSFAER